MDLSRLQDRTTLAPFFRQAERFGDRPLIHHHREGGWRPVSWREMRDRALAIAGRLVEEGIRPGDRVIVMAPNRVEWLNADTAIQAAGAITVPVYPSSTKDTARAIVENSEAVLAFAGDDQLAAKLKGPGGLQRVVLMDSELAGWMSTPPGSETLAEVERRILAVGPDDLATIVYTSGTTGEPKGVMLTQRAIADIIDSCLEVFPIGEDDVSLSFLPFSHIFERVNGAYLGVVAGGTGYLARSFDTLVEDIAVARPTLMTGVPRVFEKMHQAVMAEVEKQPAWKQSLFRWALRTGRAGGPLRPLADRLVLKPIRTRLTGGRLRFFVSGGAPLAPHIEEFFWALGIKILQGWGMTETASGATSNTLEAHRVGTVGRPLPRVEVRIAGDGELLVKSPGNMTGYYRNQKATDELLDSDGWLHTGDVGELDSDGFLRITDRKKDLIKTAGGKFVAPQPLEARLADDPLIERSVVLGDERPYVVALVVPAWDAVRSRLGLAGEPDQLVKDERLREAIQKRIEQVNSGLGSWETIKQFTLLPHDFSEERGELTPSLKVKRRVVQESYKDAIEEMYAQGKDYQRDRKAG